MLSVGYPGLLIMDTRRRRKRADEELKDAAVIREVVSHELILVKTLRRVKDLKSTDASTLNACSEEKQLVHLSSHLLEDGNEDEEEDALAGDNLKINTNLISNLII